MSIKFAGWVETHLLFNLALYDKVVCRRIQGEILGFGWFPGQPGDYTNTSWLKRTRLYEASELPPYLRNLRLPAVRLKLSRFVPSLRKTFRKFQSQPFPATSFKHILSKFHQDSPALSAQQHLSIVDHSSPTTYFWNPIICMFPSRTSEWPFSHYSTLGLHATTCGVGTWKPETLRLDGFECHCIPRNANLGN